MSSDPIVGKKLGDYIIVDILGQGGMARVYRGLDKKLNRYAAVKVIDASSIREDEAEYRQRFQNEARAIARLSHPNIVGIYQYDQIDSLYYMAMSFIEGKDLRGILKTHDKNGTHMTGQEVLRIIRDIGEALDYAHSEGVIHRDIKPSNIMVTSNGRAILTDFGLALSVPEGTIGNTFGSAHYIAPEQAVNSAQAVPQSDIYSLGIVLFEMLTNRVPFDDPSAMAVAMKHLTDPPPPPSRINPSLGPEVDKLVVRALDKDPKKRYMNCAELIAHLEKALATSDDVVMEMLNMVIKPPANLATTAPPAPTAVPAASKASKPSVPAASTQTKGGSETRPYAVMDDTPTVKDSKPSPTAMKRMLNASSGIGSKLVPVVVIAGALAIGAFFLSQNSQQVKTNEAATQISSGATATVPATETALVIAEAATSTPEPTETPVPPTTTPLPVAATDVPASATPPDVVVTSTGNVDSIANMPIVLRYDDQVLTVYNQSDKSVDMSRLSFVQITATGAEIEFDSDDWSQGGGRSISAFPTGDCLLVSRIDREYSIGDISPDYCGRVQGWRTISVQKLFWISGETNASFEVRRGSIVLAVCSIPAAGEKSECGLDTKPQQGG